MTLLVILLVLAWLALPLVPALRELYRPQDASPLALGVHGLPGAVPQTTDNRTHADDAQTTKASTARAELKSDPVPEEVRVGADTCGREPVRARRIVLPAGCSAPRPLAAEIEVRLESGAVFRSVAAPRITVDLQDDSCARTLAPHTESCWSPDSVCPGATWYPIQNWWKAERSVALCARRVVKGTLVCTGDVVLGEQAVLVGDLKATGSVRLSAGARVTGNIVADKVFVAREARVGGNIVAEGRASLGPLVVVGALTRPATVLGDEVELDAGCLVHGAVVAHRKARVLG